MESSDPDDSYSTNDESPTQVTRASRSDHFGAGAKTYRASQPAGFKQAGFKQEALGDPAPELSAPGRNAPGPPATERSVRTGTLANSRMRPHPPKPLRVRDGRAVGPASRVTEAPPRCRPGALGGISKTYEEYACRSTPP
ncbi:hypothetical protein GCM10018782_64120 [Streptomyces griseoaurantiacus]|nr:hypothetical protein GCM10018782_64120 [Streptomyces griseoaurantiacus]